MSEDPRVSDLLLQWEEAQQRGQLLSAEQLCQACPDLTHSVEKRIRALQAVSVALDLSLYEDEQTEKDPLQNWASEAVEGGVPGFEIQAELGRGGAGVVYKARQSALDRTVAIKMLIGGHYAGDVALSRFRTEARTLAQLSHPHVIQIFDISAFQGSPYFVLEYCDAGDLADLVGKTPLPVDEAVALVELLARAVHQVHQAGVIHRDLKPGNVLLLSVPAEARTQPPGAICLRGKWYIPKLTDFGLARSLENAGNLTNTGTVVGTPAFMAPEQAQGKSQKVCPATDVYSLGVLLYQLLTGTLPFQPDASWKLMQDVLLKTPEAPSSRAEKIPPALDAICLQCLGKEPEDRYPTAEGLADDLRRFRDGKPVHAKLRTATKKPRRRWPWAVASLATCVLATLLFAFWPGPDEDEAYAEPETAATPRVLNPAPAIKKPDVVIGVLLRPGARDKAEGKAILRGAAIAIDELNALGRATWSLRIEMIDEDGCLSAARKLVEQHKARVLLGPLQENERQELAGFLKEKDCLLLLPISTHGLEQINQVIYLGPTPSQYATATCKWMEAKKIRGVEAIAGDDTIHALVLDLQLRSLFKQMPLAGVGESVQIDSAEGVEAFARTAKLGNEPELVISICGPIRNQQLLKALQPREVPVLWVGRGQGVDGEARPGPRWVVESFDPSLKNALPALREKLLEGPVSDPLLATYVGVQMWALAAERTSNLAPDSIKSALADIGFEGLGSCIRMDPNTGYIIREFYVSVLDAKGQLQQVFPVDSGANLPFPPPLAAAAWRDQLGRWRKNHAQRDER